MNLIRSATWSCGHSALQRITTQSPSGATKIPTACPYCGTEGVKISAPAPDPSRGGMILPPLDTTTERYRRLSDRARLVLENRRNLAIGFGQGELYAPAAIAELERAGYLPLEENVCPRCQGPNDHGTECVDYYRSKRKEERRPSTT